MKQGNRTEDIQWNFIHLHITPKHYKAHHVTKIIESHIYHLSPPIKHNVILD